MTNHVKEPNPGAVNLTVLKLNMCINQILPSSVTFWAQIIYFSPRSPEFTGEDQCDVSLLQLSACKDSVRCGSVSSKDSVTYSNTIFTKHSENHQQPERHPACRRTFHNLRLLAAVAGRKVAEVERAVQKLELTGKGAVQMRAGSETNLASAGKQNKRTSFRQSLAVCTERAQVETC